VVVNSTGSDEGLGAIVPAGVEVIRRPNVGMNIGAWDGGYRAFPDFPGFVFLQDECFAIRDGWLSGLLAPLQDPKVGLVGESMNGNWDQPWPALRRSNEGVAMPGHDLDGRPANRVDVYLDAMARWGIEPGESGVHLRSLIWASRRDALEAIHGFPSGGSYGECIAAEIGVSRAMLQHGYRLATAAREPFHYVRHAEWNQDVAGGPFTHKPQLKAQIERLKVEKAELLVRIAQLEARVAALSNAPTSGVGGRSHE
jgi:hypothetical protein